MDLQRALGIIPANVADPAALLRIGNTQAVPAWVTLFSYQFLHSGWFHLLANMTCLWIFGILAEPTLGTKRFALAYVAFGVLTGVSIVTLIPSWTGPMVGASGSISGILGAFLALRYAETRSRQRLSLANLFEALPLLAGVAWLVSRNIPAEPDRVTSATWHLIPFLLAWYGFRTGSGVASRPWHCGPVEQPR
jgi:membrane associated rhomboid family serine protease